jgi:hypothetical protein
MAVKAKPRKTTATIVHMYTGREKWPVKGVRSPALPHLSRHACAHAASRDVSPTTRWLGRVKGRHRTCQSRAVP